MPPANLYSNKIHRKVNSNPPKRLITDVLLSIILKDRQKQASITRQAIQILFDLLGTETGRIQIEEVLQSCSGIH